MRKSCKEVLYGRMGGSNFGLSLEGNLSFSALLNGHLEPWNFSKIGGCGKAADRPGVGKPRDRTPGIKAAPGQSIYTELTGMTCTKILEKLRSGPKQVMKTTAGSRSGTAIRDICVLPSRA